MPALQIEPVHPASDGAEESDLPGSAAVRDIEDFEAHGRGPTAVVLGEAFVVHEHHIAGDAHLVRVNVAGNAHLGNHTRMRRLREVEYRGPVRRGHVADVAVPPVDDDLPPAGRVEISHPIQCRGNPPAAAHRPPFPKRCATSITRLPVPAILLCWAWVSAGRRRSPDTGNSKRVIPRLVATRRPPLRRAGEILRGE